MHWGCFVRTLTPPLLCRRTPRPGAARMCVCVPLLVRVRVRRGALLGAFWCASLSPVAGSGALFACSALSGFGLPFLWLLLFFAFRFFFLLSFCAPPLSLAFGVFRPGLPWALASCCPPAQPLPSFFVFSSPSPLRLFFFCTCLFLFFFSFSLFGLCGAGLVCVSLSVGCGDVCCCGQCAPAGALLCLRCVVRCFKVVPVICVLLPVGLCVPDGTPPGVPLPCAASRALFRCCVLCSCSAALAACRCPSVLCLGCPVALLLCCFFFLKYKLLCIAPLVHRNASPLEKR